MFRWRRLVLLAVALLVVLALSLVLGIFGGGGRAPTGRVLAANGAPAPPGTVVVALGAEGSPTAKTDSTGAFRFDPLPRGTVAFVAHLGAVAAKTPVGVSPVRIRLPATMDLRGRVVGPSALYPVVGAIVSCGTKKGVTGRRGGFELAGVPVGRNGLPPIVVEAAGYQRLRLPAREGMDLDDLFLKLRR